MKKKLKKQSVQRAVDAEHFRQEGSAASSSAQSGCVVTEKPSPKMAAAVVDRRHASSRHIFLHHESVCTVFNCG